LLNANPETFESTTTKMKQALAVLLVFLATSAGAQTKQINIGYYKYSGVFWQSSGQSSWYEFELDTRGITKKPITFHNVIFNVKGAAEGTYPEFSYITTGENCGLSKTPGTFNPCDIALFPVAKDWQCATTEDQGITWKQNCISIALQFVAPGAKGFTFELVDGTKFCAPGIINIFLEAQPDNRMLDPVCSVDGCKGILGPIILKSTC
jgi:hypothetical protein